MKKMIIDNGHEIPYKDIWKDYVYWCDECNCYHIPIDTYSKFDKLPSQTDELINLIDNERT